jgi:hypothetical protein
MMQVLFNAIMGAIKADKGRDVNRTLVLVGVAYLCWQCSVIEKRLSIVESRILDHWGQSATNRQHVASVPRP